MARKVQRVIHVHAIFLFWGVKVDAGTHRHTCLHTVGSGSHKVQEYLPSISHTSQIISTTRDVTSQNSSDLSLGRRPLSKSEELFEVTSLVVEK